MIVTLVIGWGALLADVLFGLAYLGMTCAPLLGLGWRLPNRCDLGILCLITAPCVVGAIAGITLILTA